MEPRFRVDPDFQSFRSDHLYEGSHQVFGGIGLRHRFNAVADILGCFAGARLAGGAA